MSQEIQDAIQRTANTEACKIQILQKGVTLTSYNPTVLKKKPCNFSRLPKG